LDRPRRRSLVLIAAALGLEAAAPSSPPPLRAMRWLAGPADVTVSMTTRPFECVRLPADAGGIWRVEVGRAAFRDPLLLGGQAARAGLTCESCHLAGRTNPQFAVPGISGPPGTADVTNFLFSAHRGSHVGQPRPIPDLAEPKSRLKVSQATSSRALETFIHGLVTEEFDGPPPPAAVVDGLAAYVRAMDPADCPPGAGQRLRVEAGVDDARRAVRAAAQALDRGDPATAVVTLQAARAALFAIAERYPGARLAADRQGVIVADLDLAAAIVAIRAADADAPPRLTAWLARSGAWAAPLIRDERRSLYEPHMLADEETARLGR
jgi:hypothetical protein